MAARAAFGGLLKLGEGLKATMCLEVSRLGKFNSRAGSLSNVESTRER